MTDLNVTFTTVSLPTGTSGTITVYEDQTGDGTSDYSDSVALSNGVTEYTLTGYQGGSNDVWPEVDLDNTDVTATGSTVELLSVDVAGVQATTQALATTDATTSAIGEGLPTTQALATTDATTSVIGEGLTTTQASASTTATTTAVGSGSAITTASAVTSATATSDASPRAISTADATTSANTVVANGQTAIQTVDAWQVVAENQQSPVTGFAPRIEDAAYDVDPVQDTANPFGDFAVAKMDDRAGEKFDLYPRGEQVELYPPNESNSPRFTGYVVERRETEQSGADALEVEAYSFDQFLRRNTVTNDQRGTLLTEALQDIIQSDTPVTYNSANVNVGDDQELTRSYQGVKVENVLRDLAFKSNNEEFGVDDNLEFFFKPRESEHIDRGIDNSQWFNYDIPELGKQAINEVEVWFSDGNESVIVDDGTDKLDLQDSLGLADPGTQRAELNRPLITDISDAEDIGRKYLQFKNATLSGTVTTYGLYEAEPGDTIDIEIAARGIDEEFVIAAVEYRWGRDETVLTIVEKRGEQDGILTELNDSVQRVEMNGANRDAPKNRITSTNATGIVDVSVNADGNTPTGTRFVNDGRRAVRDGWVGESNPAISNIVVGDSGGGLSRSNDTLTNQTNSASVTESFPTATSAEYSASITQTGVEEVGLETASGTLLTRATFDSPVDLAGTVTVTLDVSNDTGVSRGVLTNDGQEAVRDVLADNTPATPTDYAYGSDGTAVSESDTALGNEVVSASLESILIQSASGTGLANITPAFGADEPLEVGGAGVSNLAIARTIQGEDADNFDSGNNVSDVNFAGGVALSTNLAAGGTGGLFGRWAIFFQYDIPAEHVGIAFRDEITNTTDDVVWSFNGNDLDEIQSVSSKSLGWTNVSDDGFYTSGTSYGYDGGDLTSGNTYYLEAQVQSGGDATNYNVDVVCIYDRRYESDITFDNTVHEDNGHLDGPQEFAELQTFALDTATTRRNVTEASFDLTPTGFGFNGSYVELANDGSTYTRIQDDEGTVTFSSRSSGVDTNVGLGRFETPIDSTPRTGYDAQSFNNWSLTANPAAMVSEDIGEASTRAIVSPNTTGVVGETIREAGLKSSGTLLTRHELAEFEVLADQRLASAESTTFTGSE